MLFQSKKAPLQFTLLNTTPVFITFHLPSSNFIPSRINPFHGVLLHSIPLLSIPLNFSTHITPFHFCPLYLLQSNPSYSNPHHSSQFNPHNFTVFHSTPFWSIPIQDFPIKLIPQHFIPFIIAPFRTTSTFSNLFHPSLIYCNSIQAISSNPVMFHYLPIQSTPHHLISFYSFWLQSNPLLPAYCISIQTTPIFFPAIHSRILYYTIL